ncbi:glycosyltransferase family 39 protein, partial [Candidatus Pacearchaeota archaeon]|nr:glycosyltransferase family 39 protein [Candidatus Pacearchaeota archaeon]
MKLNKKYLQTFIFILVYLYAIYFWSQPLQERKLPYGEYDAMSHFEVADYIAYHDKSFMKLPPYIDLRYGNDNQFRPHTLWYSPAFHSSLAAAEAIGGERVVPVFLMNAILSTFIIITVYFVISSLFGFLPAILSAILLIFSPRDFMPHLWGQWPERFAYALIPIILYCFYKYLASFQQEKKDQKYIYFAALFLGIDILVHPLAFFHSAAGLLVLYIFMAIKHRKAFFNLKHLAIAALIFIVLFMMFPYQTLDIFSTFKSKPNSQAPAMDFSRMFKWSLNPADYSGSVPSNYFSFGEMHGLWTMPFLLLGILFLALRREDKDMLLLAWLVSLYLVLHRDFVGKATFLHRSLSATAHIFAPLTAIGAVSIASFVRLPANYKIYLKYGIAALFAALAIYFNFAYASRVLNKDTYN